ncbi:MAG TPA: hypothetical protein VH092_32260 [Urbifossiella sp.]|jgi:hypothetical protein|nr:hypothetical protein [Urbifossiella sp.]
MAITKPGKTPKPAAARGDGKQQRIKTILAELQTLVQDGAGAEPQANGARPAGGHHRPGGHHPPPAGGGTQIQVFEDDPFLQAVAGAEPVPEEPVPSDLPENDHQDLQTRINEPRPEPGSFPPESPEFLYWNAASALALGVNFWAPLLPDGTHWSSDQLPLAVELDAGVDLNAFYSRESGLNFFHDTVDGRTVFSGESPGVVCHELGHAILDAVKPELWDAASIEAGAFHEAFGDMSSMLSALQLPAVREAVLEQTGGRLDANSRLSQLARQLGWAIRVKFGPDAVDADCLRNTSNSFFYQDPAGLPRAPRRASSRPKCIPSPGSSRVPSWTSWRACSGPARGATRTRCWPSRGTPGGS